MRCRNIEIVAFPVKGGVDIILVQEYIAPGVTYADVLDVHLVALFCYSVIRTCHVKWTVFVYMVVEGPRVMVITNVAGGVYDYTSFLVTQDKTCW